ncbi:MAG: hypothetical protein ACPG8W_20420 [Candidatus Promineifilaceae bacterium]
MIRPNSASILLLPGFDEVWVTQVMKQLQAKGYRTSTIGLKVRSVQGLLGLQVLVDQALPTPSGKMYLLIPDAITSLPTLMTEPRIHRLVHAVLADNGTVFVAPSVAAAFTRVGLQAIKSPNYSIITTTQGLSEGL